MISINKKIHWVPLRGPVYYSFIYSVQIWDTVLVSKNNFLKEDLKMDKEDLQANMKILISITLDEIGVDSQ